MGPRPLLAAVVVVVVLVVFQPWGPHRLQGEHHESAGVESVEVVVADGEEDGVVEEAVAGAEVDGP